MCIEEVDRRKPKYFFYCAVTAKEPIAILWQDANSSIPKLAIRQYVNTSVEARGCGTKCCCTEMTNMIQI